MTLGSEENVGRSAMELFFLDFFWLGGTTGSASYQRSGGCGFEAY